MRECICLAILLALNLNAASNRRELPDLGKTWLNTVVVNGSGAVTSGQAVAADAEGHFYVGGHFKDSARFGTNVFTSRHSFDAYLAKYDWERNFIWVITIENAAAYACTVYRPEAVFLTGYVHGDTLFGNTPFKCLGRGDSFLAKFDAAGRVLWVKQAGGPDGAQAMDVAVDAAGNSYVTGGFGREAIFEEVKLSSQKYRDLFVAKYDPHGKLLWVKRDGGVFCQARGIAVDVTGSVYVTGVFKKSAQFGVETLSSMEGNDMFLVKYDSDGKFLWARCPGGAPERLGLRLAVDGQANPHVVGLFKSSLDFGPTKIRIVEPKHHTNLFLAKYDSEGAFHWVRQFQRGDFDFSKVVAVRSHTMARAAQYTTAASALNSNQASEAKAEALKVALAEAGTKLATGPPSGPILHLIKTDEFIILFWPKEFAKFGLESSENLTPFPIWETDLQKPELVGELMVVSVPINGAHNFYRLRSTER